MIWSNFKILNINWDRCILSLNDMFHIRWQTFSTSTPCSCLIIMCMSKFSTVWPVSVSFLLRTAIVSSCYPLVASLFLFLILGWICKWGLTFPLFFSHWRLRLTRLQLPLLHCSSGQYVLPISGPSVCALGLAKSTAFDSNLEYFLMEIHMWTNCSDLRPWNMYVKFHI